MTPCRLHILGASGSGTTTLARAIAGHWSVPAHDTDDYFWQPTEPPYTVQRPIPERIALMEQMFLPRGRWVLSGSLISWGAPVMERVEAVVFLTLDPAERMARLTAREVLRRGAPPPEDDAFMVWARGYDDPAFLGRSRRHHEDWLAAQHQPILHLDSAAPVADLVQAVEDWAP